MLNKIVCECESFDEYSNEFDVRLVSNKVIIENYDLKIILDLRTFEELKEKVNSIE